MVSLPLRPEQLGADWLLTQMSPGDKRIVHPDLGSLGPGDLYFSGLPQVVYRAAGFRKQCTENRVFGDSFIRTHTKKDLFYGDRV